MYLTAQKILKNLIILLIMGAGFLLLSSLVAYAVPVECVDGTMIETSGAAGQNGGVCRNHGGPASASTAGTGTPASQPNTGTADTGSPELNTWLQNVINVLSLVVGLVVVFSIIIAGIQYMTAGGNASQVAAAKNRISMAVLAFILFAFTYAILQWLVPGGIFNT